MWPVAGGRSPWRCWRPRSAPAPQARQVGADADGAPRDQGQREALLEGARIDGGDGPAAAQALHTQAVLSSDHICDFPPPVTCRQRWRADAM